MKLKTSLALVTGGFTREKVISLQSADYIEKNLDKEKYEVYKIIIEPTNWYYVDANGSKYEIDRNNFTLTIAGKTIRFTIVLIAIHGTPGEDGKLQGYFDMLNIPYTTCDALTSALTMNKDYTKAIVANIDQLYIARSKQLFSNTQHAIDLIHTTLQLPYFVKPNNGGSSIGMSKVKTLKELPEALEKAFQEDTQVLVEEFVQGKEFTIGIYKNKKDLIALPITEVVTAKEFFDFEAKYTPGLADEITPGRIHPNDLHKLEHLAKEIYNKLNCKGIVRMDFILEESSGNFYFIELNSVPGLTENSLVPKQIKAAGFTMKEFLTELIEIALS